MLNVYKAMRANKFQIIYYDCLPQRWTGTRWSVVSRSQGCLFLHCFWVYSCTILNRLWTNAKIRYMYDFTGNTGLHQVHSPFKTIITFQHSLLVCCLFRKWWLPYKFMSLVLFLQVTYYFWVKRIYLYNLISCFMCMQNDSVTYS